MYKLTLTKGKGNLYFRVLFLNDVRRWGYSLSLIANQVKWEVIYNRKMMAVNAHIYQTFPYTYSDLCTVAIV